MLSQLRASIAREAERIRTDGTLPMGFEEEIIGRYRAIADDPQQLQRDFLTSLDPAPAGSSLESAPPPSLGRHDDMGPKALLRRVKSSGRRLVGRPVRSLQRRALVSGTRHYEQASMWAQVSSERLGRLACRGRGAAVLGRLTAGIPAAGPKSWDPPVSHSVPAALRIDAVGSLGDLELDHFLESKIMGAAGCAGPVVQVGVRQGPLMERLSRLGLEVRSGDDRGPTGADTLGPLELLGREAPDSIGGIVLTGVVDRLTPSRARVLVDLVSSRLVSGGVLVLVSTDPAHLMDGDPVASDLERYRPVQAATWRYLLARRGFSNIESCEASAGTAFGVSANAP
jgi:hypothetical protein